MHDPLLWSRRLVRTTLAKTLGPFLPVDQFLVLGYHRVVERFEWEAPLTMPSSLVSVGMLERHLDCIGRDHDFVSLDELGQQLTAGRRRARPLAAVTFDDGYRDVYEHAYPMLVRKGIPAAVFVVTNLVGTSDLQTHDHLHSLLRIALRRWTRPAATLKTEVAALQIPEARRLRLPETDDAFVWARLMLTAFSSRSLRLVIDRLEREFGDDRLVPTGFMPMTWGMVEEMHRAGFTVGSHTSRHALLTNESSARVFEEVASSRRELQRRLRAPIEHIAYPDGRFNRTALKAVRLAGYRFGYTTCQHRDRRQPLLTIPRRVLWEHSAVDMRGRFVPALLRHQERVWLLGGRACSWQSHA